MFKGLSIILITNQEILIKINQFILKIPSSSIKALNLIKSKFNILSKTQIDTTIKELKFFSK